MQSTADFQLLGGEMLIESGDTVFNDGAVTFFGANLKGGAASSVWVNKDSSSLKLGGTVFSTNGTLDPSGSGNTVNYYKAGAQTIATPLSSYHNLTLSSSGAKTLSGYTDIDSNLTVSGTAQLASANYVINVGGNWNISSANADPFVEGTGEVIFDGNTSQTITNTNDETFYKVEVNKSGGDINLASFTDMTITDTLNLLSGDIKISSNLFKTTSSTVITGGSANSYIHADTGTVRRFMNSNRSYSYPIGDVDDYSPMTFTMNSFTGGGSGYIDIGVTDAVHPNISGSYHISRYWTLNSNDFSTINYDLTYNYVNSDVVGLENNLIAARWNSSTWTTYNNADTLNNELSTGSGITALPANHDFSADSTGAVLPIELLSFQAQLNGTKVKLDWSTASEIENDYYTIERSADGFNFEGILDVPAAGTKYSRTSYTSFDEHPLHGVSYYRLKQTDKSSEYSYSGIIAIHRIGLEPTQIRVYPNPILSGETINVDYGVGELENREVRVNLFDMKGESVYRNILVPDQNVRQVEFTPAGLQSGVYVLVVGIEKAIFKQRLIITQRSR